MGLNATLQLIALFLTTHLNAHLLPAALLVKANTFVGTDIAHALGLAKAAMSQAESRILALIATQPLVVLRLLPV